MTLKTFAFNSILRFAKNKAEKDRKDNKPFDVNGLRKDLESYNMLIKLFEPVRKDINFDDTTLGGVFAFHAKPPTKTKRTILYLHGGGYVLGLQLQRNAYRYFTAELSNACEADVWAIEYRLAPENMYPTALEDAYAAYLELIENGIDPKDLFVMGDSAGGGLTFALLMKLRDEGKPLPKAAVPLSPWTDLAGTGESMISRASIDPLLTPYGLTGMASLYVSSEKLKDPYASPLYGTFDEIPPLMILVGGHEILYDDSIRIAEKAKEAGVDVLLDINEDMFHVYPVFGGIFKEGREAIERIATFVRNQEE